MRAVTDVGGRAFFLAAAALAAYLAWKAIQRRRFLRQIQLDRITPEELNARLAAGEDIVVIDLRHSAEFETDHSSLPRARPLAGGFEGWRSKGYPLETPPGSRERSTPA